MAKCQDCAQEKLTADSCTFNNILMGIQGDFYERDTTYYDKNERCHDCGILNQKGNYHHLGCGIERCPKCGLQLLSCDCSEGRKIIPLIVHKPVKPVDFEAWENNFEEPVY